MSLKKPETVYFPAARKLCPVCGKVSYSLSGEHPQCAIARADAVTRAKRAKSAALSRPAAAAHPVRPGK